MEMASEMAYRGDRLWLRRRRGRRRGRLTSAARAGASRHRNAAHHRAGRALRQCARLRVGSRGRAAERGKSVCHLMRSVLQRLHWRWQGTSSCASVRPLLPKMPPPPPTPPPRIPCNSSALPIPEVAPVMPPEMAFALPSVPEASALAMPAGGLDWPITLSHHSGITGYAETQSLVHPYSQSSAIIAP